MPIKNTYITFSTVLTIFLLKKEPPFLGNQLGLMLNSLDREQGERSEGLINLWILTLTDKNKVQKWGKLHKANYSSSLVKTYFALKSITACFYFPHTEDKLYGFSLSTKSMWQLSIQKWDDNFLAWKKALLPISNQKCSSRVGISGCCSRSHGEYVENHEWNFIVV